MNLSAERAVLGAVLHYPDKFSDAAARITAAEDDCRVVEIRERCVKSLYDTAIILCGWDRMVGSILHQAVCEWLQDCVERKVPKVGLFLPRDFLKTTIFSALMVWCWLRNRELRWLLAHASSEVSSKLVPVIQTIILSDAMKHFFPELVPNPATVSWNKRELEIRREGNYAQASLEAHGVGSSLEGLHFDKHAFDDIVDRRASRSVVEMEEVRSFFRHTVSLFDSPDTEQAFLAATLWQGRFYEREIIDNPEWECLVLGAECDQRYVDFMDKMGYSHAYKGMRMSNGRPCTGDAIWPEWFNNQRLRQRFKSLGPVDYCRQMLNIEAVDEESLFTDKMIQYYYVGDKNELRISNNRSCAISECDIYITVDIGGGETSKADESVINVSAWHRKMGWCFVLEEQAGRWLPLELVNRIIDTAEVW